MSNADVAMDRRYWRLPEMVVTDDDALLVCLHSEILGDARVVEADYWRFAAEYLVEGACATAAQGNVELVVIHRAGLDLALTRLAVAVGLRLPRLESGRARVLTGGPLDMAEGRETVIHEVLLRSDDDMWEPRQVGEVIGGDDYIGCVDWRDLVGKGGGRPRDIVTHGEVDGGVVRQDRP